MVELMELQAPLTAPWVSADLLWPPVFMALGAFPRRLGSPYQNLGAPASSHCRASSAISGGTVLAAG